MTEVAARQFGRSHQEEIVLACCNEPYRLWLDVPYIIKGYAGFLEPIISYCVHRHEG